MNQGRSKNGISPTSRRQFAKAVALLAAAPLVQPVQAVHGKDKAPDPRQPAKAESQEPLAAAADALTEIVRVRHGKHLQEDELKQVRQSIHGSLRGAERLKQVKLKNSDEPAFVFSADLP